MNLVLVRHISKDKAYELLETSFHNVSHFKPEIMKKTLDYSEGNEYIGLFNANDKKNCLILASINPGYGPSNSCFQLHELLGFQKGYGKIMIQLLCKYLKKIWLQCELSYNESTDTYTINNNLANGFYRKISELKECIIEQSIWNCPANFFYHGIALNDMLNFLNLNFKNENT